MRSSIRSISSPFVLNLFVPSPPFVGLVVISFIRSFVRLFVLSSVSGFICSFFVYTYVGGVFLFVRCFVPLFVHLNHFLLLTVWIFVFFLHYLLLCSFVTLFVRSSTCFFVYLFVSFNVAYVFLYVFQGHDGLPVAVYLSSLPPPTALHHLLHRPPPPHHPSPQPAGGHSPPPRH